MNMVAVVCRNERCKKSFLTSVDMLREFKADNQICPDCSDPKITEIRHKVVYGYYDRKEVKNKIAEKIMEEMNEI